MSSPSTQFDAAGLSAELVRPSFRARCAADGGPAASCRRPGRPVVGCRETVCPAFTALRVERGLSLSRISYLAKRRKLWISKSTLAAIESGEQLPRLHHLRAIAAALRLELRIVRQLFELVAPSVRI